MLFHAVQAYKAVYPKMPGINILKPGLIYPIDWRRTVWGPNDGPGMWLLCATSIEGLPVTMPVNLNIQVFTGLPEAQCGIHILQVFWGELPGLSALF